MIWIIEHWTGSDEWLPYLVGDDDGYELSEDDAVARCEEYRRTYPGREFRVARYGRVS